MPEAGGEYVYLSEAYGPLWGFVYGWTQMWVAKSGSIATLATGFFEYLANFWPELERVFLTVPLPLGAHGAPLEIRYGQMLAMALILLLGVLNYFGVKVGGDVQVAVTVVKVASDRGDYRGWALVRAILTGRTHRQCWLRLTVLPVFLRRWWPRCGPMTDGTTSAWWLRKFGSRSAILPLALDWRHRWP